MYLAMAGNLSSASQPVMLNQQFGLGAGRIGLLIHSTAGFIDPGFRGQVTLELSNVANLPIAIYPAMKIGQISFYQLSTPAEHPYGSPGAGSKYQGQTGPTPSRIHRDFAGGRGLNNSSSDSIPGQKP